MKALSENTDERYLGYLQEMRIPYLFAGKDKIDVELALFKLKNYIGIDTLLPESGNIINGAFQRADAIDELSLVVAPTTAKSQDKPLFTDGIVQNYKLIGYYNSERHLIRVKNCTAVDKANGN